MKNEIKTVNIMTSKRNVLKFVCSECSKEFKPDSKGIDYKIEGGKFVIYCKNCIDKWRKHYEIADLEVIPGDMSSGVPGGSKVKFKDGRVEIYQIGSLNKELVDIPDEFFEEVKKYHQAYWAEEQKKKCTDIQVVDTWDTQQIIFAFGDGKTYTVSFRVTTDGIKYNPEEVRKISADQINRINAELKDRGWYKYYIREVK